MLFSIRKLLQNTWLFCYLLVLCAFPPMDLLKKHYRINDFWLNDFPLVQEINFLSMHGVAWEPLLLQWCRKRTLPGCCCSWNLWKTPLLFWVGLGPTPWLGGGRWGGKRWKSCVLFWSWFHFPWSWVLFSKWCFKEIIMGEANFPDKNVLWGNNFTHPDSDLDHLLVLFLIFF